MSNQLAKTDQLEFAAPGADARIDVARIRRALQGVCWQQIELRFERDATEVDIRCAVSARDEDALVVARAPLVLASKLLDQIEALQALLGVR